MSYRILCDEHVEPQTVRYLRRAGHGAMHVRDELALGVDDEEIAQVARKGEYAILTNDRGFLDPERYPDITVICYTDNRATAYELAAMIEELTEYYPNHRDLPRVIFLSE